MPEASNYIDNTGVVLELKHLLKICYGMSLVGAVSDTVKYKNIRIYHYFTKSKSEYLEKLNRRKADSTNFRDMGDFIKHDKNDVYDDEIIRWRRGQREQDGKS